MGIFFWARGASFSSTRGCLGAFSAGGVGHLTRDTQLRGGEPGGEWSGGRWWSSSGKEKDMEKGGREGPSKDPRLHSPTWKNIRLLRSRNRDNNNVKYINMKRMMLMLTFKKLKVCGACHHSERNDHSPASSCSRFLSWSILHLVTEWAFETKILCLCTFHTNTRISTGPAF